MCKGFVAHTWILDIREIQCRCLLPLIRRDYQTALAELLALVSMGMSEVEKGSILPSGTIQISRTKGRLGGDSVEKVHDQSLRADFVASDFATVVISEFCFIHPRRKKSVSKFSGQISGGRLFQHYPDKADITERLMD